MESESLPKTDVPNVWTNRKIKMWRNVAILFALGAICSLWAVGQPWAKVNLSQNPNAVCGSTSTVQTISTQGNQITTNVPVACATGWQLLETQDQTNANRVYGAVQVAPAQVPTLGPLPLVSALLALCALIAAWGMLARNAIIIFLALLPWQFANGAMSLTKKAITWGLTPSQVTFGLGLNVTALLATLCFVFVLLGVLFTARTNHLARKAANSNADALNWASKVLIRTGDAIGGSRAGQGQTIVHDGTVENHTHM